uniref:Non-specific serine/threonine protein kinase n=1 Tax=Arundo donax TaxID=35708 RepID=A0A0A9CYQ7_ARUDO
MDSSLSNIATFESPSSARGNRQQIFMEPPIGLRPHFPAERKWALGLQSRAHPREIMTEVLKALQELNVYWKKIGHYNMKCRWSAGFPGQENMNHNNHNFSAESIATVDLRERLNLIKFEIQVTVSFLVCFQYN